MTVELKKVDISIRDMDRAILVEAMGCDSENLKAQAFTYSYGEVVLILEALAKKMLGIYGVAVGNSPERAAKLGVSNEKRDFAEERKKARKTAANKAQLKVILERLSVEEKFVNKLEADFDPVAWAKIGELKEILCRRAMALHRAGLVEYNVDNVVADEAEQREKLQGGTGRVPMEGSVSLTEKGARCVSTQRWPVLRRRQRSDAHQFDYDVEIPRG